MTLQNANLNRTYSISVADHELQFRADGTIWVPAYKTLLVADLHLGKENSFRAAGIPVPQGPTSDCLQRLTAAADETSCNDLVILGDMFHDRQSVNDVLTLELEKWLAQLQPVNTKLILGNHDRRIRTFPENWILETVDRLALGPFDLVHDPTVQSDSYSDRLQIGGHIHPVVKVGRVDAMRMKCFAVYHDRIVLPAFGSFTGGQLVSHQAMLHCLVFDQQQMAIWDLQLDGEAGDQQNRM